MANEMRQIKILAGLSGDDFLSTLESGIQRLSEGKKGVERSSCYIINEPTVTEEEEAVRAMCAVLEMMKNQGSADKDVEKLLTSAGLQEDRTRLLLSQQRTLIEMASVHKSSQVVVEDLVELQWKLGVVAASSEKGEAGRTFIQVNFISQPHRGVKRTARLVEMSLEKFYDFLHQLEKCKAILDHKNITI